MSLVTPVPCSAADYFVSLQGNDSHDGSSASEAFATLQKGLDALTPGDTLIIAPGEYHQSMRREKLGNADAPTTIRAAIPGTVLLRGDVPVDGFKPVKGERFVYVADYKAPAAGVQSVQEQDTRTRYESMPNITELAYGPGRFYYDQQAQKLYISTSDWQPADTHRLTAAVIPTHGIFLAEATNVIIQDIAVTGYFASFFQDRNDNSMGATWGIFIDKPRNCVIRNCTAYLNGGGIGINSQVDRDMGYGGNLIDTCTAWSNGTAFANSDSGGITIYKPARDEIRNCTSFLNRGYGMNFYLGAAWAQRPENQSRIVGGLAWGNGMADVKIKTGVDDVHTTEHTVAFYPSNDYDPSHMLVGTAHLKNGTFNSDNIALDEEKDLVLQDEFADPDNHDYRLQATSRFRAAGPDGSDRGPLPYKANVYFISNDGSDQADGLSVTHAWKSLSHAAQTLKAGDTLYLLPGVHAGLTGVKMNGTKDQPIHIRGRGVEPVEIQGALALDQSSHVIFERVHFSQPVTLANSKAIHFGNCRFTTDTLSLSASDTIGLKVSHSEFTGFNNAAIVLTRCSETNLAGNVLDNAHGPALRMDSHKTLLYADYNAYRNAAAAWEIGSKTLDLTSLKPMHERYASVLAGGSAVTQAGPLGRQAGGFRDAEMEVEPKLITRPVVHSLSATTANIEWFTSKPIQCVLAWGLTPDCNESEERAVAYFGSFSLTGLTPGTTYYFRIKQLKDMPGILEAIGYGESTGQTYPAMAMEEVLSFTTPAADAQPRLLHVATNGSDDNDGTSSEKAWRTIAHAASLVNVGDTVLIAAGQYDEHIRIRATGASHAPITFTSKPGQKVTLTGDHMKLNIAFSTSDKSHLKFDRLYFNDYSYGDYPKHAGLIAVAAIFNLYGGKDIQITRCFADGRGGYPASLVSLWQTADVLVKNSVSINNMGGSFNVWRSPNLRIENFVSVRPLIKSLVVNNTSDQKVIIRNSIFTDMLKKKAQLNIAFMEVEEVDALEFSNNLFHIREFTAEQRNLVTQVNHAQRKIIGNFTLASMDPKGITGTLIADPKFAADRSSDGEFGIDTLINTNPSLDFNHFFATNPQLVSRDIGLQTQAFADYDFMKHAAAVSASH